MLRKGVIKVDRISFNETAKLKFEQEGGAENFTTYVMSEILSPIEDYENAVKIIKAHCNQQIDTNLLIIGAYLTAIWPFEKNNELLELLNKKYDNLANSEKAIVNYINAKNIFFRRGEKGKAYRDELMKSMEYDFPFVNNHCDYATISAPEDAVKHYELALKNVEAVFSERDIQALPEQYFFSPQSYIKEFVLGTHLSVEAYNSLKRLLEIKQKEIYHNYNAASLNLL